MTKDGIVSGIIGIALCFVGPFVDAGAIAEHAQRSPVGFALLLLGTILVGYFISCLVHYDDRKLRETSDELRRELAKSQVKYDLLLASVGQNGAKAESGMTPDDVNGAIEDYMKDHTISNEQISSLFDEKDESRPHFEKRANGNWTLRLPK